MNLNTFSFYQLLEVYVRKNFFSFFLIDFFFFKFAQFIEFSLVINIFSLILYYGFNFLNSNKQNQIFFFNSFCLFIFCQKFFYLFKKCLFTLLVFIFVLFSISNIGNLCLLFLLLKIQLLFSLIFFFLPFLCFPFCKYTFFNSISSFHLFSLIIFCYFFQLLDLEANSLLFIFFLFIFQQNYLKLQI